MLLCDCPEADDGVGEAGCVTAEKMIVALEYDKAEADRPWTALALAYQEIFQPFIDIHCIAPEYVPEHCWPQPQSMCDHAGHDGDQGQLIF